MEGGNFYNKDPSALMGANVCGAAQVSYLNAGYLISLISHSSLLLTPGYLFLFSLCLLTQPPFQTLSTAFSSSLVHTAVNMGPATLKKLILQL